MFPRELQHGVIRPWIRVFGNRSDAVHVTCGADHDVIQRFVARRALDVETQRCSYTFDTTGIQIPHQDGGRVVPKS